MQVWIYLNESWWLITLLISTLYYYYQLIVNSVVQRLNKYALIQRLHYQQFTNICSFCVQFFSRNGWNACWISGVLCVKSTEKKTENVRVTLVEKRNRRGDDEGPLAVFLSAPSSPQSVVSLWYIFLFPWQSRWHDTNARPLTLQ